MTRRSMGSGGLLWGEERRVLWCVVLGLMMVCPSICGAQMTLKVETLFSTENGMVRLETDYRSLFTNSSLAGVQENQYFNDMYGKGSPTKVGAEFETNGNSEIAFAGLSVLKQPSETGDATLLRAVEKVGTGFENSRDSFGAAGGSEISVTETLHSTNASTQNGNLVYLVKSTGEGQMSAGVAGEFNRECVECNKPEPSGKGQMGDLPLETGVQSGIAAGTLTSGFQRVDMHIEMNGQYSGAFQAVIKPAN